MQTNGEKRAQVAFVGGASRGIGRVVAERLARDGHDLVLCSRNPVSVGEAADKIASEYGIRTLAAAGDLAQAADLERVADAALAEFGRIDVLFANTGGPRSGRFPVLEEADWYAAHELLLMSFVRLVKRFVPGMIEAGEGRIILLTSVGTRQPWDTLLLSSVYRSAATATAKFLSRQYGSAGVTVNCVAPGVTETERWLEVCEARAASLGTTVEEECAKDVADTVLGRPGTPGEIAEVVAFLASPKAAFVTGTVVNVDGGMTRAIS